ncbi:MAG: hypothetical protein GX444_21700 [Myxococcales bacterium]|nr:hypothetical protein [Myxococcales bacterium]
MLGKIASFIEIVFGIILFVAVGLSSAGDSFDLKEGNYFLKYDSNNAFQWGLAVGEEELVNFLSAPSGTAIYTWSFRSTKDESVSLLRRIEASGEIGWEKHFSPSFGSSGSIFVGLNDEIILVTDEDYAKILTGYNSAGGEILSIEISEDDADHKIYRAFIDSSGNIILGMENFYQSDEYSATIAKYDSSGIQLYEYNIENAVFGQLILDEENNPYYSFLIYKDQLRNYKIGRLAENGEPLWEDNLDGDNNADFDCNIGEPDALILDNEKQELSFAGIKLCSLEGDEKKGVLLKAKRKLSGETLDNGEIIISYPYLIMEIDFDQDKNIYVFGDDFSEEGLAINKYSTQTGLELWQWKESEYQDAPDYNVVPYLTAFNKLYMAGELGFFKGLLSQGRVKPFYSIYDENGNLECENRLELLPIYNARVDNIIVSSEKDVYLFTEIVKRTPTKSATDGTGSEGNDDNPSEGCGC